jgi:hypothetical protein
MILKLAFAAVLALAASVPSTDAPLWPEHRAKIDGWRARVDAVNADPGIPPGDGEGKAVAEELASTPAETLTAKEWLGEWRVRSIQGTRYGVFTYPWFKARVTERNGKLFFEKTTGSQRRSGWLYAPIDGGKEWVFAGGASVNEDPQVPYSRDAGAAAPAETDSVGVAWKIGDGRLVMALDVRGDDYEIYQLKRP